MAVSMDELLADLAAETAVLDGWLAPLSDRDWARPTPAAGWTIADQISHLAYFDDMAVLAATRPDDFRAHLAEVAADIDGFTERIAAEHRRRAPADLRTWFTSARGALAATFAAIDPRARLPWYGPDMSATSAITARIMETWAHGQDVADALGVEHPTTGAVAQVAFLGVRTKDFSFSLHDSLHDADPGAPVRVELAAPDGTEWSFGPPDAPDVVRGPAIDFCLVVTQRRHVDDTKLEVHGATARQWMHIAQAFAGPPGDGRSPTTHR